VELDVYNVAGQKVGTLVDQELTAGYKVVTWNGTDQSGHPVASGIYFYRVVADDFRASRRMILVR
jgi:flagellar hook assembly protein FlgD